MDFLTVIVIFGLGFFFGKIYAYYSVVRLLKDLAEETGVDFEKELKNAYGETETETENIVRKLKIDVSGDVLYLFDHDTDTFICQAECVQDLAKLAKERSQILYAVVKHGDKFFTFKDGESSEVKA